MCSVQVASDDIVTSLISHVFPDVPTSSIESSMSSLTLEDKSVISGTNTIATLLSTKSGRVGASEIEKAEVQQWLSESAKEQTDDALLSLNTYLAQQTFLVGDDWTVCDLVYAIRLQPTITKWDAKRQSEYCHVTRWFNHIRNLPELKSFKGLTPFEIAKFDKSVTIAIKQGAPKESVPKDANRTNPSQPATQTKPPKKEKSKIEPELSPSMISFKIGRILKAELHPDADSLYVSQIDLGESEPRTVVSGLVKYIPLDKMVRDVVCICNLKPAAMRGIKSSAMVLAASPSTGEKDTVELVTPPEGKPGTVLQFQGFEGTPEVQLNPKKKVFEQIQPGFSTTPELEVIYKDAKSGKTGKLCTSEGKSCRVDSLVAASIR